jgi:hypothetical protein
MGRERTLSIPGERRFGALLLLSISIVLDTVPPFLNPIDCVEAILLVLTCMLLSIDVSTGFLYALLRFFFRQWFSL